MKKILIRMFIKNFFFFFHFLRQNVKFSASSFLQWQNKSEIVTVLRFKQQLYEQKFQVFNPQFKSKFTQLQTIVDHCNLIMTLINGNRLLCICLNIISEEKEIQIILNMLF